MTISSDDLQTSNLTPAASQSSKAEQLARTRRNQQRCRERKRAHVAELESQVDALQAKIRQCEPCTPPSEHESAPDTALRENAARRDLLLALGFDDEAQQRFIESAAKRKAVYTILNMGDRDRTSLLQTSSEWPAETQPASLACFDAQFARTAADFADLGSGSGHVIASRNANSELRNVAINRQANALDPAIENWLFSPETLDTFPPSSMDPASDISWFVEPGHSRVDLRQTNSTLPLGTMPISSVNGLSNGLQGTSLAPDNQFDGPFTNMPR